MPIFLRGQPSGNQEFASWTLSSTFTRVREVGQEVTKKDLEKASGSGGKQTFELFALTWHSIANPATRKSTEFNFGA